MNERVVLVAIRYLAIAVALLHTSLGAKPTLRVVYSLDDVDNKNELECIVDGFIRAGAIFTFKEPGTEAVEDSVMERHFTIHPNNESLVTCTIDSEESVPVRVAAIPQYTAGVQTIRQYVYSDSERVDIVCPFELGRLRELYGFSWDGVASDGLRGPLTNGSRGLYWLAEEDNRILHVNILAAGDRRNFECVGTVQTCTGSTSCTTQRRNSPTITIMTTTDPQAIVNISITPEAISTQSVATFVCTSFWMSDNFSSNHIIKWKIDGIRYDSSRCEQKPTLCNITTLSTDDLTQMTNLYVFINTTKQSVTVMCAAHFVEGGTEMRLPFVDQQVQIEFVCTELSDPEGGTVNYTMKSIGSSAEYRCMSSHLQLSTSDTTRTCTNTGWSGEAPFCICKELQQIPEEVNISYTGHRHIGSAANYVCNEYMTSRTCNATIGWDGDEPKCKCLTSPEGGILTLTDFLSIGSQARYTCDNTREGLTLECLRDGTWDRDPLICFCKELPDPIKGTIEYSMNRSVGSIATYKDFKCGGGYELSGDTTRTCSGNGWDGVNPTCELTMATTVIISVLATFTAVIIILAIIYFFMTLYKRKRESRRELIYDVPYAYELPPLPPRILRRNSGIYDTISNGSNGDPQNQPQTMIDNNTSQCQSRSLDRVALADSEVPVVVSCIATLNNSSLRNESDAEDTANDAAISQCPPVSPVEALIGTRPSTQLDLSSERANETETEPPLNLEIGEITDLEELTGVEDQIGELRILGMNVTANVLYQPSTRFQLERNPAYNTNVAIAPEIETSENVAYEHCESNNISLIP